VPGSAGGPALLEVRDLRVYFPITRGAVFRRTVGHVHAVDGITVGLAAGETVGLVGESGSGKTTLGRAIVGLIRPTSGTIDYGSLGKRRDDVRARLGWVGHDTLCYPDLTGRENIELAARLAGVDVTAAWKRSADRFSIGEFGSRPMRTGSRGQRQRVALARALVHQPDLVLLDEPSTGLDKASVARAVRVIGEEAERGGMVVMITHDATIAHDIKTTRYQMDRGRLSA